MSSSSSSDSRYSYPCLVHCWKSSVIVFVSLFLSSYHRHHHHHHHQTGGLFLPWVGTKSAVCYHFVCIILFRSSYHHCHNSHHHHHHRHHHHQLRDQAEGCYAHCQNTVIIVCIMVIIIVKAIFIIIVIIIIKLNVIMPKVGYNLYWQSVWSLVFTLRYWPVCIFIISGYSGHHYHQCHHNNHRHQERSCNVHHQCLVLIYSLCLLMLYL